MLVLTRKTNQKLIINDNIEVVILETRGESVKLGIKAPKDVTIYRQEIYEEIKKANKQASNNVLVNDLDIAFNLFGNNKKTPTSSYMDKLQNVVNKTNKKSD